MLDTTPYTTTRPSISTRVRWALETLRTMDTLAGRTDGHGRPMYTHEASGLTFVLHEDSRGFEVRHDDEPVATVRVDRHATAPKTLYAAIVPADDSWTADCRDLGDRLPDAWAWGLKDTMPGDLAK